MFKTYMNMSKIGLNIGTQSDCCGSCKHALKMQDSHFVRCIYHNFFPFKQFICNNYGNGRIDT